MHKELDTDGDGYVTLKEFTDNMERLGIQSLDAHDFTKIYMIMDSNNDE